MAIKKEINFFKQAGADIGAGNDKSIGIIPLVRPFAVAALLVLICWGFFSVLNFNAGHRLSAIAASLGGSSTPAGNAGESGGMMEDMLHAELDYNDESRLTAARLKAAMALQPDGLEVLGVTYYGKLITVDGFSRRELCGADFAKLLRASPLFSNVEYTGVTASDGGYSFSVSFGCSGEAAEVAQ